MEPQSLLIQLKSLPNHPGIYIFKDAGARILYIGKAKSLKNRVRSYFRLSSALEPAKQQMVPKIASLDTIVCDTENEALILEANLIRQHRPPYNILLTDDKFYLFIKITKEEYPRIFPVRRVLKDGARYFGPYSSARSVRNTLKLLRRIFPYRGEKETTHDRIFPHPLFSLWLKSAPRSSANGQSEVGLPETPDKDVYGINIQNTLRFLSGDREGVAARLRAGMKRASGERAFERAAIFRDQLSAIERLEGNQKVFLPRPESFDILSLATHYTRSAVNVFQVRSGRLLGKNTFLLKHPNKTSAGDIIRQFVLQYYRDALDIPPKIFLPQPIPDMSTLPYPNKLQPRLKVPHRGQKRRLLVMGELNARQLLSTSDTAFIQDQRLISATRELSRAIGLKDIPLSRVETYDISNLQGELATGSLVVFINGQPSPKDYRKFRIRRSAAPNDYAMLEEVIERRLAHHRHDWPLPGLIIVDGGKGQLSSALKVLRRLQLNIPLAALAKKEELLFVAGRLEPVRLPYDSDALYLIQRMRDEAHRFTISYHRLLRSRRLNRSRLDDIPGLGPKTRRKLLQRFGSVQAIKSAALSDLERAIGKKAQILKDYL